jgi:HAD superfamily hydrolase (TIGR01509 family)
MIRAVLFDMDGVLYDSMRNHAAAWVQSMQKFGIHMTADDAYATEGARGVDTIRYMVRQQKGIEISEAEAQDMYDEKSRIFHSMPEAPIMPGILSLMEQIDAAGISIGVVTGSGQRPLIARILRDFGQFVSPEHITTAYDVPRGKPHPDPYLIGMKKAGGLSSSEAIVVENAPLGVRAGIAAGCYTIAVNTGPLPDQVLLDAGASILFPSMPALSDAWKEVISKIH